MEEERKRVDKKRWVREKEKRIRVRVRKKEKQKERNQRWKKVKGDRRKKKKKKSKDIKDVHEKKEMGRRINKRREKESMFWEKWRNKKII